jgi:hypothetical protein
MRGAGQRVFYFCTVLAHTHTHTHTHYAHTSTRVDVDGDADAPCVVGNAASICGTNPLFGLNGDGGVVVLGCVA